MIRHPRARRGNYVLLLVVALVVLLGFGALAIDTAYVLLVRAQAQDVADAASQAAALVLRSTGDTDQAQAAAEQVVALNEVGGEAADLVELEFGAWDDSLVDPTFVTPAYHPNAVRATVAREGQRAVPFLLAKMWGYEDIDVRARAVSASRSVQVAIVLDITGSWGEADFNDARTAVLGALDMLTATAADVDEVALTIFTNRYAWAYTPFTNVADPSLAAAVRGNWTLLNIASKGGEDANPTDGVDCALHPLASRNDFTDPPGGCYPPMPREYTDEPGTDHSTGILLAQQLFEEGSGGANFRAMIVLTDGRPNDLGAASGTLRADEGYVETRWREYVGPVPRSKDEIRAASIQATGELWSDLRVHTWVVSLVAYDEMMPAMVRGDGYDVVASDSAELAAILAQIIAQMPLAIVE